VGARVPRDLRDDLDRLVKATGRNRNALIEEALRRFVEVAQWQLADTEAGVREADAVVDSTILLFPQDQHLAETSTRAASILERAGITVDDLLADLPAVREEVLRDSYGDTFVDALERRHAKSRSSSGARPR
jgi:predicted DNA-binding protein